MSMKKVTRTCKLQVNIKESHQVQVRAVKIKAKNTHGLSQHAAHNPTLWYQQTGTYW